MVLTFSRMGSPILLMRNSLLSRLLALASLTKARTSNSQDISSRSLSLKLHFHSHSLTLSHSIKVGLRRHFRKIT